MANTMEDQLLARADALIAKGEALLAAQKSPPANVISDNYVPSEDFATWRTQSVAFLTELAAASPAARSYCDSFEAQVQPHGYAGYTQTGVGILRGAREDIAAGHLIRVRQLVAAELFSDFLEMAEHLHASGFIAPAASLAGAVLEEALRKVATARGLKGKNLESLNDQAAQQELYDRIIYKQVKVWIDIRNAADHGEFDKLTADSVGAMLRDLPGFLGKIS